MLDMIKYNDIEYELKRKLSFGEVRQYQKSLGNLLGMEEKIKGANDEQLEKIAEESMKSTDNQMELVASTLKDCLGFTEDKLKTIDFLTAVMLFNEVFTASTQVKKKLGQQYG